MQPQLPQLPHTHTHVPTTRHTANVYDTLPTQHTANVYDTLPTQHTANGCFAAVVVQGKTSEECMKAYIAEIEKSDPIWRDNASLANYSE